VRARRRIAPSCRYYAIGFRCVREEQTNFTQTSQVLRGNSWCGDAANCRAANRYGIDPDDAVGYLGFRCARSQ
jgi:formylglycine-generating enzyme required for sulfatase activity